jgi:hypothetical protein
MDFELNQKFCDLSADPTNCATNGITPLRTQGDKLITYDLSRGGTRATMSIRTWNGSAWGPTTVLSNQDPVLALGTINTTGIAAGNSLSSLGALDPRTFGEASIAFSALFGTNTCGQFGSTYLKSRASDSFTAALKDFVPPQQVTISNCTDLETEATTPVTVGDQITDTATLTGGSNPTVTITCKLYGSLEDCEADQNVLFSDEAEVDSTTGSATSAPIPRPPLAPYTGSQATKAITTTTPSPARATTRTSRA